MAEPGPASWADIVVAVAVTIGTAVGSAFAAFKMRRHRNGQITRADLLEMRREIEGESKKDRRELYGELHKLSAAIELDFNRLNDNLAQYAKSNEERLRLMEKEHSERMRQIELQLAARG